MYYCVSEMHVWHQNTTSGEPETLSMKTVTIVYLFIVYDILSIFLVSWWKRWFWFIYVSVNCINCEYYVFIWLTNNFHQSFCQQPFFSDKCTSVKTDEIYWYIETQDPIRTKVCKMEGQVWKWSNQSLDSYIWSAHAPELS